MTKISTATVSIIFFVSFTACVQALPLHTETGNEISASMGSYRYEEPGLMSLEGYKLGINLQATRALPDESFVRGDVRFAFGQVDYSSYGTGSAVGHPSWYMEARGLVGDDWEGDNAVLAFYTGIGYRHLFHDGRGITTTGHFGYRRESNYLYLPVGVIHRSELEDDARLVLTLEYDYLLIGKQVSRLSDGGQGHSDPINSQDKGYGLKANITYDKNKWAIGPYVSYWNIEDSDITPTYINGLPDGYGLEPKNNTLEFGIKAGQQF
ncbi:MAG: hypothetical protein ABL860_05310 [Candidatus Nitrotoga sp.]